MRVEPLGDSAYILRDLDAPAHRVANWLNLRRPSGLIEAVSSYDAVGLYVEPGFDPGQIILSGDYVAIEPSHHRIPICYEMGEDLQEASQLLRMNPENLIELHQSETYTCYAVGFCPGFAYLGYLPEPLRGLPRRPSPRVRVEPGSLGITGSQTGVYPLPRPGGWFLIGRTPLTLVDVAEEYFPIQAGDTVSFEKIDLTDFKALQSGRL